MPLFTIIYMYLLIKKSNQSYKAYEIIFISIFIEMIILTMQSLSLVQTFFIFKYTNEGIVVHHDFQYYVITVMSKIILFGVLYFIGKKVTIFKLDLNKKYCMIISLMIALSIFMTSYICDMISFQSGQSITVYLLLMSYNILVILIVWLVAEIYKDTEKNKQKEIELVELKSIEEKYRTIQFQNKRNEEIRHDLEYFLSMIVKKEQTEKIKELLENTIQKIDDQNITIYSQNKIMNSLLTEMKNIAEIFHQKVMYNVNIDATDMTLTQYKDILIFFEKLCKNNQAEYMDINIQTIKGYMILEFIISPQEKLILQDNENIVQEKIEQYESIKYFIKL